MGGLVVWGPRSDAKSSAEKYHFFDVFFLCMSSSYVIITYNNRKGHHHALHHIIHHWPHHRQHHLFNKASYIMKTLIIIALAFIFNNYVGFALSFVGAAVFNIGQAISKLPEML